MALKRITADSFRNSGLRGFLSYACYKVEGPNAQDFADAKRAGANHLRIWLKAEPGSWAPGATQLKHFAECASICQDLGMYIVALFSADEDREKLWIEPKAADRYIDGIVSLVKAYKGRKVIAAIDLINEPSPSALPFYRPWCEQAVAAIRKADPDRVCIVETCPDAMPNAEFWHIPGTVPSIHTYGPWEVTHWHLSSANGQTYRWNAGTRSAYLEYKIKWLTWVRDNSLPGYDGEFSCINVNPDAAEYVDFNIRMNEAYGVSWCFCAWRQWPGWEPEITWGKAAPKTQAEIESFPYTRSWETPLMKVLLAAFAR